MRSIYAGYHWFSDWGRDTMISLEGLTLATGRYREAGAILRTFSHYVRDGLLPNLFPEGEREALYHTVDATLVVLPCDRTLCRGHRRSVDPAGSCFRCCSRSSSIIVAGTRFGIRVDPADGLLAAAAEGYQLTWMDAKVDDWVVTPRRGKPVEIQALWYNALQADGWRGARSSAPTIAATTSTPTRARESFNERFWNARTGCLYDVIDGPDGDDASIRPNQVFAISLPHPILRAPLGAGVETVRNRLVTAYGLRTLSAEHPDYKSHYRGDLRSRDAAYHQGTVWPWLIGHFIDAYLRVRPDRVGARQLLRAFPEHLVRSGRGQHQ